jgi:hypothetical protein
MWNCCRCGLNDQAEMQSVNTRNLFIFFAIPIISQRQKIKSEQESTPMRLLFVKKQETCFFYYILLLSADHDELKKKFF